MKKPGQPGFFIWFIGPALLNMSGSYYLRTAFVNRQYK